MLEGLRILVLEDEFLIAMDVEQICRDAGAADVVLARTLEEAEAFCSESTFDAAVVDIFLGQQSTFAFASSLKARGTPFIFASGYSDLGENAAEFADVTVVGKPYEETELVKALAASRLKA
ncbi:response regulator [Pseudaminobacter sp. 19-2017]|uniref:Response regulator n=1 Tax=Pseudaminobacter soli (ex Zhang et al. 2022) TaxID=2831468 RepID=A0A942I308_9HYPH|nr:response regulator [Pseudaminobacter soli]MBS3650537.1 response regulator [Pseudaminobacter soli]